MRKTSNVLILSGVVLVGTFLIFRYLTLKAQNTAWHPFVATLVETAFKSDGTLASTQNSLHAVARDGSRVDVFRMELPDHNWVYSRKILSLSTGSKITVESSTKSVITEPMPEEWVQHYAALPDPNCGAGLGPVTREILGYHTVRVPEQHSMPQDYSLRVEQWLAPALGCYPLYFKSDYGPRGGPAARNIREVLFVVERDPPDSFFQVRSDFKERSPSELNAEFERFFPGHAFYPDGGTRADRNYYESRSNKQKEQR